MPRRKTTDVTPMATTIERNPNPDMAPLGKTVKPWTLS